MEFWVTILIIFVGSSIACFVQRYVGFAYGLISLTIWISFIETSIAIILSLFGAFLGQCINLKNNKSIEIKSARFFLLGGILGMLLSFYYLSNISLFDVKAGLGVVMVLFFIINMSLSRDALNYKENKIAELFVGIIGGGMGVLGAGFGIAPSVWCTINSYSKQSYFNIMIIFNMMVIVFSALFYFVYSGVKLNYLYFIVVILSICVSNVLFDSQKIDINFSKIRIIVNFIVLFQGLLLVFQCFVM